MAAIPALPEAGDLEDLFENAPCGYLETLPNGRISRVNRTFSTWTGFASEQLVGRRFLDLLNIAGKIYYETHFAPLLRLQGSFNEVALDVCVRTGRPCRSSSTPLSVGTRRASSASSGSRCSTPPTVGATSRTCSTHAVPRSRPGSRCRISTRPWRRASPTGPAPWSGPGGCRGTCSPSPVRMASSPGSTAHGRSIWAGKPPIS
ncbi:PAS domain-containing protein [Methylobacterium sp. GC_Met_2]|uniref:PAS domain-containing protein n=1 Tax=Methylobacterium sp. GC_Met_2 TaxID=2937376 RepID=UPI00226B6BBA